MVGWGGRPRFRRRLKASATVEMAVIAPLTLLTFLLIVYTIFYFHDKNVLCGAAYEAASVGSVKAREEDFDQQDISRLLEEQLRRKCIILNEIDHEVTLSDETLAIRITGKYKEMSTTIYQKMPIEIPEKEIRRREAWKENLP